MIARPRRRDGRDGVVCVVLGRGANDEKVDHWLRQGAPRGGLRRLRDRPHHLVGRPEGLPRREHRARGRRASRSPTTTCASWSVYTTRRRRSPASGPGAHRVRVAFPRHADASVPRAVRGAFLEEADESVVRRERLAEGGRSARGCAASSASARPAGALRAARADDRGHGRAGHDRDVRDARA